MKQVLFLDDDYRRIYEIRSRADVLEADLTIVETAHECIEQLASQTFDLVLLDHDLGGETYVDSNRVDCGMEVVRWLVDNGGEHGAFIVHTMNSVAAAAMYMELDQLGYPVRQAAFGSSEFYSHLFDLLGLDYGRRKKRSRSMSDRIRAYFRSLRL
jgi:CheY-like chemotaxis protein